MNRGKGAVKLNASNKYFLNNAADPTKWKAFFNREYL